MSRTCTEEKYGGKPCTGTGVQICNEHPCREFDFLMLKYQCTSCKTFTNSTFWAVNLCINSTEKIMLQQLMVNGLLLGHAVQAVVVAPCGGLVPRRNMVGSHAMGLQYRNAISNYVVSLNFCC